MRLVSHLLLAALLLVQGAVAAWAMPMPASGAVDEASMPCHGDDPAPTASCCDGADCLCVALCSPAAASLPAVSRPLLPAARSVFAERQLPLLAPHQLSLLRPPIPLSR